MIDARMALLAVLAALSTASPALAGPYCQPTNGRDQIAKTGSTCPINYLASGPCCIALHADSPRAVGRLPGRACPTGSFASAGHCVSSADAVRCHESRRSTRWTCTGCHLPPRGVGMP